MTPLPESTLALCFACILLTPCAAAGLALTNAGLGRSRNASHSLLSTLAVFASAALVYFAVGFAWLGYSGRPEHDVTLAGNVWNWSGAERFLMRGVQFDGSALSLAAVLGMVSAGLVSIIPLGAAAERWRLGSACASTALLAGWTFPLFAHWSWGGGWLAHFKFIDSGGGASIHAIGGLTALSMAWILGPRRGKFEGPMPAAIPGHSAAFVLFGCFLAWLGWMAMDCAGAILYTGIAIARVPLVAVNATLAAGSAMLVAIAITRLRFSKIDASLSANGWVAGLAASSAGCVAIRPAAAVLIGAIAGALVIFSVEWLEFHLKVDDPGGAISVHGLSALWGLLATGMFAAGQDQWIAQLVGVSTLIGFVLPLTYGLNWLLNLVSPQRIAPEGERQGLDLHELGAGAYPDFVSHNEDMA